MDVRIDEIVLQTLEKERDLRQQSATEVKTDVHLATQPGASQRKQPEKDAASHGTSDLGILALCLFLAGFLGFPLLSGILRGAEVIVVCDCCSCSLSCLDC